MGVRPLPSDNNTERSQTLENLLGNYMITDHQLSRLRDRIIDYSSSNKATKSRFMMRSEKGVWFEVKVEINQMTEDEPEPEEEQTEPVEATAIAVLDIADESDEPTDSGATASNTTHFP